MRILLVNGSELIRQVLRAEKFVIETADDALEMFDFLAAYQFDVVLIGAPLMDTPVGKAIADIRARRVQTGIIVMSDQPADAVEWLNIGADDVVMYTRPPAETIARIRCVVRRSRGHTASVISHRGLNINLTTHMVDYNGDAVHFTGKEYGMIEALLLRRNQLVTKGMFLNHLYAGLDEPESKIIDVFICKLRIKLNRLGLHDFIETVWGRGYIVRDELIQSPPLVPSMNHMEAV